MFETVQMPITDSDHCLWELLQSAPDAILELDSEGRIVLLNRMTEQLFGYTPGELLGQTVEALIPDALRGGHERHRAQYLNQQVTRPIGSGLKAGGAPQGRLALPRRDQPQSGEFRHRISSHCHHS
jgi:PAS domain-containing protein